MTESELTELHLADLHARAAERGIEGYRLLRRDELIERLGGEAPDAGAARPADDDDEGASPRRRRGRRGGRRGRRDRERLTERDDAEASGRERRPDDREDEAKRGATPAGETVEVRGILELTRQRHGFIRDRALGARDDDVYVSASQVRRCELRPGDEVSGPAREPRRGERHRALVHVDSVNGEPPQEEGRVDFESLTPAVPTRRIELPAGSGTLARAADLLAPLAFGQRVLVSAAPRSGRTTLLRELAAALAATPARAIVLLIDERPEELPAWRELEGVELALAPADLAPRDQVRVAVLACERARRLAESGADAVLLCDSLSRLAVAAEDVGEVKRLFGSGRDLAEAGAGSLTVVATAFGDGEDEGSALRAVSTTETALISLDPSLAGEGIVPALRFADCRVVGEQDLLPERQLEGLRRLRAALREKVAPEAAAELRERIAATSSNAEILDSLA